MTWDGTGTPVAQVSGAGKTPVGLITELNIIFGANATGDDNRQTLVKSAAQDAAKNLWLAAPWTFRHTRLTVATVANQVYITLPADYANEIQSGDFLFEATDRVVQLQYVAPDQWDATTYYMPKTSDVPTIWTQDNISIASVLTPVILVAPTPTAVKSLTGLNYFAGLPTWADASTAPYFPDHRMDHIWQLAAQYLCGVKGLIPQENPRAAVSLDMVTAAMDAIRTPLVWRRPHKRPRDVRHDVDRLRVTHWNGTGIFPWNPYTISQ